MAHQCVSIWKCQCGLHLKAVTTFDIDDPQHCAVLCPKCGIERNIDGSQVLSVTQEFGESVGAV